MHTDPSAESARNDGSRGNKAGHGTCMLARVVGYRGGIAKNATPVIVRMSDRFMGLTTAALEGLLRVLQDVTGKRTKAVVSMSLGVPTDFSEGSPRLRRADGGNGITPYRRAMHSLLQRLAREGVTLVAAAGNQYAVRLREALRGLT